MVRRPPRERQIWRPTTPIGRPGFESRFSRGSFSRPNHTSDSKIGTPVATLPGAWPYRVSTGAGWPRISTLRLCGITSWICNFCLSVVERAIIRAIPFMRDTPACCWGVKQPTNNNNAGCFADVEVTSLPRRVSSHISMRACWSQTVAQSVGGKIEYCVTKSPLLLRPVMFCYNFVAEITSKA